LFDFKGGKMRKLRASIISAALVLGSFAVAPAANAETISGSGSSYAGKMFAECIAGYTAHTVSYNPAGSGTGKKDFAAGTTAFGASDSLYTSGYPTFKFTYIPAVAGPIAVAYNVPGLTNFRLTPKLISDIFLGKITKWNDPAIAKVNRGVKLPNEKFVVVYRKDGSGTTNNFANWLRQTVGSPWVQNDSWTTAAGGQAVGIAGDKNQGVRAEMEKSRYSIAYLDLADALQAKFGLTAVQNGAGKFVKPSVATAKNFLAAQSMKSNGVVLFDYKKTRGTASNGKATTNYYSIVLVAYAMAPTASTNAAKTKAGKEFLSYVINTCVPAKGAKLGYVAFSGSFLKTANVLLNKVK
jgi:phosphate transport system substrate-binding protein